MGAAASTGCPKNEVFTVIVKDEHAGARESPLGTAEPNAATFECQYETIKVLRDDTRLNVTGMVQLIGTDLMISASCDGYLRVWNITSGLCIRRWEAHKSRIYWLSLLNDGTVITVSEDGCIKQWNPTTGDCHRTIHQAHYGAVYRSVQLADGQLVTAGGSMTDNTLRFWDMSSGNSTKTLKGHVGSVWALLQLRDGRLASGSADGTIRIWRVDQNGTDKPYSNIVMPTNDCSSSTSTSTTNSSHGPASDSNPNPSEAPRLQFSPSNNAGIETLGTPPYGNSNHGKRKETPGASDCCAILQGHGCNGKYAEVLCVAELENELLASGGMDGCIILWDLRRIPGKPHDTLALQGATSFHGVLGNVSSAPYATPHAHLAKVNYVKKALVGHTGQVYSLCVLCDGVTLASGSADRTIRIWNTDNGHCMSILNGHKNVVERLVLLEDSLTIASGSLDKTIRFWAAVS